MIDRLAALVVARRWLAIIASLALALPLVPVGLFVPLDNSMKVWMVESSEKLATYERFRALFGSDERIVAVVRGADARERQDATLLRFVRDLARALKDRDRFPQVEDPVSIVDLVPDEVETLLDERLGGWHDFARLRKRMVESPLERGLALFDPAHDRASLSFGVRAGPPAERRALLDALEPFRERARREGRELLLAGQPFVNVALDEGAREVETRFMPLLVFVCVATMLVLTRSARMTAIALAPVAIAVLDLSGFVGVTGRTWNLILVIAKPLTFVLALATALHVAQSYMQAVRDGLSRRDAAARAFREKAVPCLFTTITAMLGFAALATADVRPIREFGLFSAAAMGASFFLIFVLLVALLAAFGPETTHERGRYDRFGALAERIVRATSTRGRAIAVALASVALCALGVFAYTGLRIDTNALHYLPLESRVRRDYEAIEREGMGLFSVEAIVRRKDGAPIGASRDALDAVLAFERAARARPPVTATLSFADVLVDASWRSTSSDALPDAMLIKDALKTKKVREAAAKMLGDGEGANARAIRVVVLAQTTESAELLALVAELERDLARIGAPLGLEADVTGSFPLILATQLSLVATLSTSLSSAAGTIAIAVLLLVRSPRRTLFAFLPNALPIALNFGLMRVAAMPLDVGTVMCGSIVLGIAVDDAIHYLTHYGRARGRGERVLDAVATGAREAGRSLVLATAITVAGFLTLLLSSFAPTWRFGCLASFGLAVALVGAIPLLPALIVLFERDDRA